MSRAGSTSPASAGEVARSAGEGSTSPAPAGEVARSAGEGSTSPASAGEVARSAGEGSVLLAATDPRWFDLAVERWPDLLLDHANCEKKAASTALALMFSYPEDFELAGRMSRLAREELRHFELVQERLEALRVPFRRLSPSRYAEGLRKALRRTEPERRIDLLLVGALIEARSHERFLGLIPRLGEPLGPFYESLAAAEARHAGLYLKLAVRRGDGHARPRLAQLAAIEAELATSPDAEFRFHSGTPGGSD